MNTWYIILFSIQVVACLGMIIAYEVLYQTTDSVLGTAMATGEKFSYFAVAAAASTFILVEGGPMIAEKFLRNERAKGRSEGLVEGRSEGLVEGRAEERAEIKKRLEAWNARRIEAASRGELFEEPPPLLNDTDTDA